MSEMVDRAARALHAQIVKDYVGNGAWTDADPDDYDRIVNIDGHVDLVDYVRAVIAALREPSETMIAASDATRARTGEEYWKAMIDGALKP